MADNETIEERKWRIDQLESEKRQSDGASSGDSEEAQGDELVEQAVVRHKPVESLQVVDNDAAVERYVRAESKWSVVTRFTRDYVIPFVRHQWKILLVSLAALVVGIWLIVNVGLFGTALLFLVLAGVIYAAIQDTKTEEFQEQRKERRKRRSHSRERKALWLYLNDKFGKGNVRCVYCKQRMHRLDRTIHLDHKIPVKRGGKDVFSNMHLVHAKCNEKKGATTHEEYKQKVARERQKAKRQGQSSKQTKRPTRPGRPRR